MRCLRGLTAAATNTTMFLCLMQQHATAIAQRSLTNGRKSAIGRAVVTGAANAVRGHCLLRAQMHVSFLFLLPRAIARVNVDFV